MEDFPLPLDLLFRKKKGIKKGKQENEEAQVFSCRKVKILAKAENVHF